MIFLTQLAGVGLVCAGVAQQTSAKDGVRGVIIDERDWMQLGNYTSDSARNKYVFGGLFC